MGTRRLTLDVGMANQLKLAFQRCGWANEEIERLIVGNILADVRNVVLGHAVIENRQNIIDQTTHEFWQVNCKIEEHYIIGNGTLRWNQAHVKLYLAPIQTEADRIDGNSIRSALAGKPLLNASILDYLLSHPHLIPKHWKRDEMGNIRYTFFWGTIYSFPGGEFSVRCLFWENDKWQTCGRSLTLEWYRNFYAAVFEV
jgi:hypothetical protein